MNEKVLVINRKNLPLNWLKEKIILSLDESTIKPLTKFIEWHEKPMVETNEKVKQIIPYIIVEQEISENIAFYERAGNEKRLHGLRSVGVGGHINIEDYTLNDDIIDIIMKSIHREMDEEFYEFEIVDDLRFLGIINEELTKVGRTHLGFVYKIIVKKGAEAAQELKNLQWDEPKNILKKYPLELWSEMALELYNFSKNGFNK
jgi:predicted NUDIX family phosphoesterase